MNNGPKIYLSQEVPQWMKDMFEDLRSAITRPSPDPPSIYGLGTTSRPNWRVAHFFAGRQSASQTSSKVRHQVRLRGRRGRRREVRPTTLLDMPSTPPHSGSAITLRLTQARPFAR